MHREHRLQGFSPFMAKPRKSRTTAETDILGRTSTTERFKDFISRHVFYPLQGMTFGTWWALLRRHRFAFDLKHLPHALVQTAISGSNSVNARIEWARIGRRIEAAQVRPHCSSSGITAAVRRTFLTFWRSIRSSPHRPSSVASVRHERSWSVATHAWRLIW
jgi:hypothetical protein